MKTGQRTIMLRSVIRRRSCITNSQHLAFLILSAFIGSAATTTLPNLFYFAIGSNMVPATMSSLRNLSPVSCTAAVLPDYELAFDIPGNALVEPSAASVRSCPGKRVHGVLYELTDADFAALGRSEGVPMTYRWERCEVTPYIGDGMCAGERALKGCARGSQQPITVTAFVLTASMFVFDKEDIPPSQSYLKILQDGAAYWNMDCEYQNELASVAFNDRVPGVSGILLRVAERLNPKSPLR